MDVDIIDGNTPHRGRKRKYKSYVEPHVHMQPPQRTSYNWRKEDKIANDVRTPAYAHDKMDDDDPDVDSTSAGGEVSSEALDLSSDTSSDTSAQSEDFSLSSSSNESGPESPFTFKEPPDSNAPLMEGTDTTNGEALSLIMAYALRHNLSETAVVDLLKLVNVLFGKEVVPETAYRFKKFFDVSDKIHIHCYCNNCSSLLGKSNDIQDDHVICQDCKHVCNMKTLKSVHFFISIPVGPQLQAKLENDDVGGKFLDRNRITPAVRCVRDIHDGSLYKKLMVEGAVLSDNHNYSYTFNTDGVAVFKSSGYSIWPVHLSINELPLRERNKHTLLAGLWFGVKDPVMSLFLDPFVQDAAMLAHEGIQWTSPQGEVIRSKFIPLIASVDSVARPLLQNMVQFNGMYGCSFCKHPGQQVPRGNGTAHVYPLELHQERSEKETLKHMRQALRDNRKIVGVKGPSILINLPHFDIINGFVPDYMHCVLLGVTRQLTNVFLKSVGNNYYIGAPRNTAVVNARLKCITPVSEITRCPRSLADCKYWKASEWKAWLLYYSIPCLKDVLPDRNLKHLSLLSRAIFLLLKECVSFDDINEAHTLLLKFVGSVEILYGKEECTFNVHLLTHLAKTVKYWGPLWAHSAFGFESANGNLVRLIKGTQFVPKQIVRKFVLKNALPLLVKRVHVNESSKHMYHHLVEQGSRSSAEKTVEGAVMLGKKVIGPPSPAETLALSEKGITPLPEIAVYKRMIFQHKVFHSIEYKRAAKRRDLVIYADHKYFVIVKIATFYEREQTNTILFVKRLKICPRPMLVSHICKVMGEEDNIMAVALDKIQQKCLYFSTGDVEYFVCHLPNIHERD